MRPLLLAALLVTLLAAPSASAATAVPVKKYQCYQFDPISGYLYGGGFTLKAGGKYRSTSGGGGKWSARGKRVTFKTGPYKPFYGKMRRDEKGKPVMDLHLKSDPENLQACYPGGR